MKPAILVSPASRGLGLAVTRHLIRTTRSPIVITCRNSPQTLKETILSDYPEAENRISILQLDVTQEHTIAEAAAVMRADLIDKGHYLRLAFICPGILRPDRAMAKVQQILCLPLP